MYTSNLKILQGSEVNNDSFAKFRNGFPKSWCIRIYKYTIFKFTGLMKKKTNLSMNNVQQVKKWKYYNSIKFNLAKKTRLISI